MSSREFDLIDRFFSDLTIVPDSVKCGIGDDAAVIDIPADKELLVSVDTLVEGSHFLASTKAFDVGYKSLAVNISDIAAMGGEAHWATLALTLPDINEDWLRGFADGFAELANEFKLSLIGGDTTVGPLSITVQIMGTVEKGKSVRRSTARPGDLVYVSGSLGAAGLACRNLLDESSELSVPQYCFDRLHRPRPRAELGPYLCKWASSAIDISDGFAADIGHVLKASNVSAAIRLDEVPVCEAIKKISDKDLIWQLALAAGDDYEICFTLPAENRTEFEEVTDVLDYPLSCVGEIAEGEGLKYLQKDGQELAIRLEGFEHF
jgi:thiamine-monophosphate kinase